MQKEKANLNLLQRIIEYLTTIFALLLVVGLPFYLKYGYYNIDFAKWDFFRFITIGTIRNNIRIPGILLIAAILEIINILSQYIFNHKKPSIKNLNIFLFLYLIVVTISNFFSFDRWVGFYGYDGWYMGLLAQYAFGLEYYFVKRYFNPKKEYLYLFIGVPIIVFLLVILNRFWIYIPPFLMRDIPRDTLVNFVSTIGNINWFASYMAVTVPVPFILFVCSEDSELRTLSFIAIIISGMTLVLQNSESILLALVPVMIALFLYSFKIKQMLLRFILLCALLFASFLGIGILRRFVFINHVPLDKRFELLCFSIYPAIALCLFVGTYLLIKKDIPQDSLPRLKKRSTYVLIIVGGLVLLYILLNNILHLPESYQIGLLTFNDSWGTNRGEIWRISIQTMQRMFHENPLRIIFGAGPDNYKFAAYYFCFDEVNVHWFSEILANAHNEWLNALVNYGIVGGGFYFAFFISGLSKIIKNRRNTILNILVFDVVLCYMVNNFVSFQQAVSTPFVIFAIALINKQIESN